MLSQKELSKHFLKFLLSSTTTVTLSQCCKKDQLLAFLHVFYYDLKCKNLDMKIDFLTTRQILKKHKIKLLGAWDRAGQDFQKHSGVIFSIVFKMSLSIKVSNNSL